LTREEDVVFAEDGNDADGVKVPGTAAGRKVYHFQAFGF
jgi:hypothetical protein